MGKLMRKMIEKIKTMNAFRRKRTGKKTKYGAFKNALLVSTILTGGAGMLAGCGDDKNEGGLYSQDDNSTDAGIVDNGGKNDDEEHNRPSIIESANIILKKGEKLEHMPPIIEFIDIDNEEHNRPPIIESINITAKEGEKLYGRVRASDPDGDILTYDVIDWGLDINGLHIDPSTGEIHSDNLLCYDIDNGPNTSYKLVVSVDDNHGHIVEAEEEYKIMHAENPFLIQDFESSQDIDYLILTDSTFSKSSFLVSLAEHRNDDYNVGVVNVSSIYQQFPKKDDMEPESIKDFIDYIYKNWQASNSKTGKLENILIVGGEEHVPAKIFFNIWGEPGLTDNYYADIEGDNVPEIAIGRFPIDNSLKLKAIVNKIINYENLGYPHENNTHLFVAPADGDILMNGGLGFAGYFDSIIEPLLPADIPVIKRYEQEDNNDLEQSKALTNAIIEDINNGVFVVSYEGHSSVHTWGNTNFGEANFTASHVSWLNNLDKPALFLSFTCLSASFNQDNGLYRGIGETLLYHDNGGAIAYVGAVLTTGAFEDIAKRMHELLYNPNFYRLGDLFVESKKQTCIDNPEVGYGHNEDMALLGDPGLKIK
ncbi:hypothetical protein KAW38_00505 [Candidatus Micrarchaeota archaeon]|nr:hypothetical protein [Candidatus Micrarchaeota archaeon]